MCHVNLFCTPVHIIPDEYCTPVHIIHDEYPAWLSKCDVLSTRGQMICCWENSSSNKTQLSTQQLFIYTDNYLRCSAQAPLLDSQHWHGENKLKPPCWPSLSRALSGEIISEAASVKLLSPALLGAPRYIISLDLLAAIIPVIFTILRAERLTPPRGVAPPLTAQA